MHNTHSSQAHNTHTHTHITSWQAASSAPQAVPNCCTHSGGGHTAPARNFLGRLPITVVRFIADKFDFHSRFPTTALSAMLYSRGQTP